VDIDPGAVEIAKLRLWLSLVVDEEDIRNIKPLPNLDYKIVRGNSLLGLPKLAMKDIQLESEIERLKIEYFNETNPTNKKQLKDRIDQVFKKLVESAKRFSSDIPDIDFEYRIHFSEVFHKRGAFDVVIANPPYIGEKANHIVFEKLSKTEQWKSFYRRRSNMYYFFIKQGIDIQNDNGYLTYIVPREFLTADWANKLRAYILKNVSIHKIIDFRDAKVFEDTGTSSLILMLKTTTDKAYTFDVYLPCFAGDFRTHNIRFTSTDFDIISVDSGTLDSTGNGLWTFDSEYSYDNSAITTLGSIFEVTQGLVTGADRVTNNHIENGYISGSFLGRGIFILKEGVDIRFRNGAIELNLHGTWKEVPLTERAFIKPYISSTNLTKWYIDRTKEWILYFGHKDYQEGLILDYLNQFKVILINRAKIFKNSIITPREFERFSTNDVKRYYSSAGAVQKIMKRKDWFLPLYERTQFDFAEPKIIVNTKKMAPFTYSDSEHLSSGDGLGGQNYIFLSKKKDRRYYKQIEMNSSIKDFMKYTNAVLNSKLISHKIRIGQYNQLSIGKIKELRFYKIDFLDRDVVVIYNKIVDSVNSIIEVIDTAATGKIYDDFEKEQVVLDHNHYINQMVYQLYGLTEEEIRIMERVV
jgi:hypothetical protein